MMQGMNFGIMSPTNPMTNMVRALSSLLIRCFPSEKVEKKSWKIFVPRFTLLSRLRLQMVIHLKWEREQRRLLQEKRATFISTEPLGV